MGQDIPQLLELLRENTTTEEEINMDVIKKELVQEVAEVILITTQHKRKLKWKQSSNSKKIGKLKE